MKKIIFFAIILSLLILFLGYPLSTLQKGYAPTDGIGSYEPKNDRYGEKTPQEFSDTLDKGYDVDEPADLYTDTYNDRPRR